LNTQNTQISSYVENIFTETPNEKFDVSVNIFSTYVEMEPIRFGSKIERQSLKKKNRDIVPKKKLSEKLEYFFGSLSKHPDFHICREYIYGNTKREIRCFRKYILYICGNGASSIWFQNRTSKFLKKDTVQKKTYFEYYTI